MGVVVDRHQGAPMGESEIIELMRAQGLALMPGATRQATPTTGTSTAMKRCCTACVAGSCFTPVAATPISVPETGWCYHRTLLMRPPSARKACTASRPPARTICRPASRAMA